MKITKRVLATVLGLVICFILAAPVMAANEQIVTSPQKLTVDGKSGNCEKYNIDGNNYFKLRDMAMLLSDTEARFDIDFDTTTATVYVTTGKAYTPVGGELSTSASNSATGVRSSWKLVVDGEKVDVAAYNIGGSNFFKLRDLGQALQFYVGYDDSTNTATVDSRYYISHVDGDTGGYNVEFYHEIPIFCGNESGLRKINNIMIAEQQNYLDNSFDGDYRFLAEWFSLHPEAQYYSEPALYNTYSAKVRTYSDDIISFTISQYHMMGGVSSYGSDGYNFDRRTGEALTLSDVLGGTEAQIRASIEKAFLEKYPGLGPAYRGNDWDSPINRMRSIAINDMQFYVEGSRVIISFPKYSIAEGAAGELSVELSVR